jgi:hypothetical protein
MTRPDARTVLDRATSERAFQLAIVELAELHGWLWYHVPDSRLCPPGFPDLALCRPPILALMELKSETGRLRPEQAKWLEWLAQCGQIVSGVWRPSDWDEIEETLR